MASDRIRLTRLRQAHANSDGDHKAVTAADDYAKKISTAWQKQVPSILETGRLLIEAKRQLKPGQFESMIKAKLPFSTRTAQRLMAIAAHPIISDPTHVSHLPPSWGTLYRLIDLPNEALEQLLADGTINCDTERDEVDDIEKRLNEEGTYLWAELRKSLNFLIKFSRKWPDPNALLASHVCDCEPDGQVGISASELIELPPWLTKLHAACQSVEVEQGTSLDVHMNDIAAKH